LRVWIVLHAVPLRKAGREPERDGNSKTGVTAPSIRSTLPRKRSRSLIIIAEALQGPTESSQGESLVEFCPNNPFLWHLR
jgi:hypothetical protein